MINTATFSCFRTNSIHYTVVTKLVNFLQEFHVLTLGTFTIGNRHFRKLCESIFFSFSDFFLGCLFKYSNLSNGVGSAKHLSLSSVTWEKAVYAVQYANFSMCILSDSLMIALLICSFLPIVMP